MFSCNVRSMETPSKPVLIRAGITAAEWTTLRQYALAVKRPVQDLVADALRAAYPLTEGTK